MASTIRGDVVVGVFPSLREAHQALAALREVGFSDERMGAITRADRSGILSALSGLGFDDAEARWFEREFRRGRALVIANVSGRAADAYDALVRGCGYDASEREAGQGGGDDGRHRPNQSA